LISKIFYRNPGPDQKPWYALFGIPRDERCGVNNWYFESYISLSFAIDLHRYAREDYTHGQ